MRINLKTPFAEKEAAKALGARWDGARKIWYITDVADLTPFMRWIPDLATASQDAAPASAQSARAADKTTAGQPGRVITRPAVALAHCGCKALPWMDCEHTA